MLRCAKNGKILDINPAGAITDTDWHHLVFSNARPDAEAYLDNVNIGDLSSLGNIELSVTRKLHIAARSFSTAANFFNGSLDETGIWNRALTSDEVALLYNSGAGLSYNSFE